MDAATGPSDAAVGAVDVSDAAAGDAALDAAAPHDIDAGAQVADSGPDPSAADGGMEKPSLQAESLPNCRLFGPLFADDRSWVLAGCSDQIGRLFLADMRFDGLGGTSGVLNEAALASDHVIYIENFSLVTLPLAGGLPQRLTNSDDYSIVALSPDRRRVVVWSKDRISEDYYNQLLDVGGVEPPLNLSQPRVQSWFEAFSADGSRAFMRGPGKPVSIRSIPIAGGVATDLGAAVLSVDAMKFAVLDAATGNITVSSVDNTPDIVWHEAGYLPTRIVSFTRDASALILDGPDGSRAVSLDGSKSVHLADVPIPPDPPDPNATHKGYADSRIGTAALFRWCAGDCRGDIRRFNVVPLDGGPAQSDEFDNCYGFASVTPHLSESGDQSVFLDGQSQIMLADARTASLTVAVTDVGRPCSPASYGISKDGSKVFATGSFGVRIADATGALLGSYPGGDVPLFSPNTRRASVLFGNELRIIELSSGDVLYRTTLSGESYSRDNFGWVDDDRFIYDDANTVYFVRL
jgi:hypothetical protein